MNSYFLNNITTINNNDIVCLVYRLKTRNTIFTPRADVANDVSVNQEATITFVDSGSTQTITAPDTRTAIDTLEGHESSDIATFLSREVAIFNTSWAHASFLQVDFDPWTLWRTNAEVQEKMKRFTLFRGTLELRFVLNGIPFHMGRVMVAYEPRVNVRQEWIDNLKMSYAAEMTMLSQLPGTGPNFLNPAESETLVFDLPFFYEYPYHSLNEPFSDLGQIFLRSPTTLTTVNDVVAPVSIEVFAAIKDAEMLVPQPRASEQIEAVAPSVVESAKAAIAGTLDTQEDKPDGTVSAVTSAFAKAAGELTGVPVIGQFMRPGMQALNVATNVAKFFGMARAPVYTDIGYFKNRNLSSIANTSGAETVSKLTFDPKQALSIDPSLCGCPTNDDELTIERITRHWSYLTTFQWSTSQTRGTRIFETLVTPSQAHVDVAVGGNIVTPTALSGLCQFFEYYRGTIEYKFVVQSTKYHTGRIAFSFDPDGTAHLPLETNVQYIQYLDIRDSNEITFSISWAQHKAWKQMLGQGLFASAVGVVYNSGNSNGSLRISVLNPLVASFSNLDVQILMFVRAGPDFQVARPSPAMMDDAITKYPTGLSEEMEFEISESLAYSRDGAGIIKFVGQPAVSSDMSSMTYFGEDVVSLRNLLKRYTLHHSNIKLNVGSTINSGIAAEFGQGGYPCGFNNYLILTDYDNFGSAGNPVQNSVFSTITPWYGGIKGGIRWKVIPSTVLMTDSVMSVGRDQSPYGVSTHIPVATSTNIDNSFRKHDWVGTDYTVIRNQPTIEYEVPCYTDKRFYPLHLTFDNASYADNSSLDLGSVVTISGIATSATEGRIQVDSLFATGEDFNLMWFLGVTPYRVI